MCRTPSSNDSTGTSKKSDPSLSDADSADEKSEEKTGAENAINTPTIHPNTIKNRKLDVKKVSIPTTLRPKKSSSAVVCSDPTCNDPNCKNNRVCTDPSRNGCDPGQTNYVRLGLFGVFWAVFALIVGYALYLKFKTKPKIPKNVSPTTISEKKLPIISQ